MARTKGLLVCVAEQIPMRRKRLGDVMGSHNDGVVAKIGSGTQVFEQGDISAKTAGGRGTFCFSEELFLCLHECNLVMRWVWCLCLKAKKKAIEEKSDWEESKCFFAWRFYPKAFFYCSTMEKGSNAFSNVCS
jgi:hypothetical protein